MCFYDAMKSSQFALSKRWRYPRIASMKRARIWRKTKTIISEVICARVDDWFDFLVGGERAWEIKKANIDERHTQPTKVPMCESSAWLSSRLDARLIVAETLIVMLRWGTAGHDEHNIQAPLRRVIFSAGRVKNRPLFSRVVYHRYR